MARPPARGTWVDAWSGETHAGPDVVERACPLDEIPVYVAAARAAALTPLFAGVDEQAARFAEQALDGATAAPFPAESQITERLGPETLAHLRAQGLGVAHLGGRSAESEDEQTSELGDTLVARSDCDPDVRAGERIQLTINAERAQLFDPASGESLLVARTSAPG